MKIVINVGETRFKCCSSDKCLSNCWCSLFGVFKFIRHEAVRLKLLGRVCFATSNVWLNNSYKSHYLRFDDQWNYADGIWPWWIKLIRFKSLWLGILACSKLESSFWKRYNLSWSLRYSYRNRLDLIHCNKWTTVFGWLLASQSQDLNLKIYFLEEPAFGWAESVFW